MIVFLISQKVELKKRSIHSMQLLECKYYIFLDESTIKSIQHLTMTKKDI